jgi:two-component system, NarL family, response regulator NreC
MKISIILVDDHRIFREGIRALLNGQADMIVIGEAEDGQTAVHLARELSPRVVIMDVAMPNLNGIEATRQILTENPDIRVIALSVHAHQRFVQEMIEAGASSYLLKECAFEELVQTIHKVADNDQVYLGPEARQLLLDHYLQSTRKGKAQTPQPLTSKERVVLQLVAEGNTSGQIARNLGISRKMVEKHRASINCKLNIDTMADLIKYAIREGLTTP